MRWSAPCVVLCFWPDLLVHVLVVVVFCSFGFDASHTMFSEQQWQREASKGLTTTDRTHPFGRVDRICFGGWRVSNMAVPSTRIECRYACKSIQTPSLAQAALQHTKHVARDLLLWKLVSLERFAKNKHMEIMEITKLRLKTVEQCFSAPTPRTTTDCT